MPELLLVATLRNLQSKDCPFNTVLFCPVLVRVRTLCEKYDFWHPWITRISSSTGWVPDKRQLLFTHSSCGSGWRTFIWWKNPPKCCSVLVWIAGCWNSLLSSHNQKNNWCLTRIFGVCSAEKIAVWDHANRDPNKQEVGLIFALSGQNSYQIFKIKSKNKKPIDIHVLFKAYPMVPLSCRSNLAERYLEVSFF